MPGHVCRKNREIGQGLQPGDEVFPEVEFVVAECHAVILKHIHGCHNRMVPFPLVIQVIGHDVALDGISVVNKDHIGLFRPYFLDIGGNPCHAGIGGFLVVLIAEPPDVAMYIGSPEYGNGLWLRLFIRCLGTKGTKAKRKQHQGNNKYFEAVLFHSLSSWHTWNDVSLPSMYL